MKAYYEVKEKCAAELKVTVDGEKWANAQNKAFNKACSNMELKGFRKGKAPKEMVRKALNPQALLMDAAETIAQEALNFGLEEHKEIRLVDRPQLDVENASETEITLKFLLTVYPTVTLGDYKSVKYDVKKVSVLKKDVDAEIEELQKKNAEEVLKEEGKIEKGNIAVIDFEGFVDGVAFEGGKGTEWPLEIGSGSFIPGFEDQLIGLSTGDEKDVNVTFPEQYTADLAGKPAVFKVKVQGIKEKKLPELNDEFVSELKIADDVKTVDELTKHIKEDLKSKRVAEAEENANNTLLDKLCEINTVELPEVMISNEVEDTMNQYAQRMQQQGFSMETYLQFTGMTKEDYKEQLKPECEKKVRIRVVLDAIGTDMGIVPSEKDLEEEYEAMSKQYSMEVAKLKEIIPASYLSEDVKMRMTMDKLKENKPEK